MNEVTTLKAISITNVLKKAGLDKAEHGTNGRMGHATQTEGFTVEAMDKTYKAQPGGKVLVRNAKNTRFSVSYAGRTTSMHGTPKFQTADALEIAFNALVSAGYSVNNEGWRLVVLGLANN